jgi:hypothetical protein
MKRGGAHIALRGAFDITPVVISVSESMLGKGQGWHRAPQHRPHFVLTVLEDMPITPYLAIARKNNEIVASPHRGDTGIHQPRALRIDNESGVQDRATGKNVVAQTRLDHAIGPVDPRNQHYDIDERRVIGDDEQTGSPQAFLMPYFIADRATPDHDAAKNMKKHLG